MKTTIIIGLIMVVLGLNGFSQTRLPIQFRVEKQAMSTPMSPIDEMFFSNFYYAKPVNIKFDGKFLNMFYDNGTSFAKKNVNEVNRDSLMDDGKLISETILYTDNENASDTISFSVDYNAGFVQITTPAKNSKGESIGYTSYRKFVKENELAMADVILKRD